MPGIHSHGIAIRHFYGDANTGLDPGLSGRALPAQQICMTTEWAHRYYTVPGAALFESFIAGLSVKLR